MNKHKIYSAFVKVLADNETDEVLGVHMIGPRCADLIAEAVTAMEYRATAEDLARMCHAHPTFTEAIKEAALDATGKRALHIWFYNTPLGVFLYIVFSYSLIRKIIGEELRK